MKKPLAKFAASTCLVCIAISAIWWALHSGLHAASGSAAFLFGVVGTPIGLLGMLVYGIQSTGRTFDLILMAAFTLPIAGPVLILKYAFGGKELWDLILGIVFTLIGLLEIKSKVMAWLGVFP